MEENDEVRTLLAWLIVLHNGGQKRVAVHRGLRDMPCKRELVTTKGTVCSMMNGVA
jgi:hypothetical protein